MTRLVRVLIATILALSLVTGGVALADDGKAPENRDAVVAKNDGKVLPGETIGPSEVYRTEKSRAARGDGDVSMALAPGWYVTSATLNRYAWTGLWVYSLTVDGYYHTTGTKIDSYGGAYATASAANYLLWQVQSTSASWAIQGSDFGMAIAQGTFTHGVPTPWGTIAIETYTDSVSAYAIP